MHFLTSDDKKYRTLAFFVMTILSIIVFTTFRDYGVSWDEEIQSQYGQAVFDYYASGLVDHRYNQLFNLYIYGGMFDGFAAFINAYTPIGIYATRHLLNALFGLLGLWGTWKLGRLIGGARVGFFALALLAITPTFYGHFFNNPKDIPFAAGIVWTLYYMAKSLREFPHVRWSVIQQIGLVFGLTLGIRVGGVMLFGYWGLALMAQSLILLFSPSSKLKELALKEKLKALILGMIRLVIPTMIAAYVVMLICWPWAQENPFINPIKALIQFSNFPQVVEVLLNGTITMSTELPWYYVPLYFYVQLPLIQLALLASALFCVRPLYRMLTLKAARTTMLILILMVGVPIYYAIAKRPALYDAVRHFTFILPLISIVGALTLSTLIDKLEELFITRKVGKLGIVAMGSLTALLSVIFVAEPVARMIQLHPYEYVYVNPLQGGVPGAFGDYELDYWGTSFKEAAEKLQKMVEGEGGIPPGKIYKIAICGPWSSAMIYLPPDYEAVQADDPADFFLATTRWMCHNMRPGKEVIRVERLGVPFSILKDLRPKVPHNIDGQEDIPPQNNQDQPEE